MLKMVHSLVQGLLLGVLFLEAIGALLVGWNWWQHRAGVEVSSGDLAAAIVVVAAMGLAPLAVVVAFFLERRVLIRATTTTWIGLSAVTIRLSLLICANGGIQFPWTLAILDGKRTDLLVGIFATCLWLGLIQLTARRERKQASSG